MSRDGWAVSRYFELVRRTTTNHNGSALRDVPGLTVFLRMIKKGDPSLRLKVTRHNYYFVYKPKEKFTFASWDDIQGIQTDTGYSTLGKLYIYPDTRVGCVEFFNKADRTMMHLNFKLVAISILKKKFLPLVRKRRWVRRFNKAFPEIVRAQANLKKRKLNE